jgi:hypothetical protein
VTLAAGNLTDVAIAVGLTAPVVLATVGAYRKSWSRDTALSAMLARLLFAAILSTWLGSMLVGLFDGQRGLSYPLLTSIALPLAWLLARFLSRNAVRRSCLLARGISLRSSWSVRACVTTARSWGTSSAA